VGSGEGLQVSHSGGNPRIRLVEEAVAPVAAATVVLLRDHGRGGGGRDRGAGGGPGASQRDRARDGGVEGAEDGGRGEEGSLEVLLVERHLGSDFAAGALVFPGGKLDDADRRLDAGRWTGRPMSWWTGVLGVEDQADALGLLVAGVRETFEEAGVLLARREDGTAVTDEDLATASFDRARRRLAGRDGHGGWADWLSDEELVLDLGALALWAWWVTPVGHHRRFDTRFFVACLPEGQSPRHDDVETTSLRWLRPTEALATCESGEAAIVFPTRRVLGSLARFPDARSAWAASDAGEIDRRRIEPTLVHGPEGEPMVQHPDGGEPEPF